MPYRDANANYKNALGDAKLKFGDVTLPVTLIANAKVFWDIFYPKGSPSIVLKTANQDSIPNDEATYALNNHFASYFSKSSFYIMPVRSEPYFINAYHRKSLLSYRENRKKIKTMVSF